MQRRTPVINLLDGFLDTVARYPSRPAVKFGERVLTYSELDDAASFLAEAIQRQALTTGGAVGILAERSIEMLCGILAIYRSGSYYVPLDPAIPPDRMRMMLEDAGATFVVTTRTQADRLPPKFPVLLSDSTLFDGPRTKGDAPAVPAIDSSALAYTMFTSGTTGRPKGVRVTHGNVLQLFAASDKVFDFSCRDVWPLCHSLAFDVSVWEIWGALLHGACLIVIPDTTLKDPAALWKLLSEERVTILCQTPTSFALLMAEDTMTAQRLPVRTVFLGGEALRFADLRPWLVKYGDFSPQLINIYGPTETTVFVCHRRIMNTDLGQHGSFIGHALPGASVALLDKDLNPVPEGEIGEIVISGPGVTLGYAGKPDLNRARFVEFSAAEGSVRGYRSGDLGRFHPDGDLEFMGRADNQVKIRGFRVELGDVETALSGHPTVQQAAAALHELPAGGQVLIGYVVAAADAHPEEIQLRKYLSGIVPEYMIPATIMVLGELPMTVGAKLDRAALPDPGIISSPADGYGHGAPLEKILCGLFAEVLGRSVVGPNADFFELGGHSQLVIRLLNRIRAVLSLEISIGAFFDARTVAALAQLARPGSTRPALQPCRRPDEIPLSYAQHRIWLIHHLHEASPVNHIPYCFYLTGRIDITALRGALWDVVSRHEILRTVYPEQDGMPFQRILALDAFRCELPVRKVAAGQLDALVQRAVQRKFDLTADLPLRAELFLLEPGSSALLLVLHHIAGDGWSLEPLLRDFGAAYTARLTERPVAWAPLSVQYVDYAVWQHELLGALDDPDSIAAQQLHFWKEYLRGIPEELALPTDRRRPNVTGLGGGYVELDIEVDLHTQVAALARAGAVTVNMVLQATMAGLLTRLGAGNDIPICNAIAGRTDVAAHPLVGLFVNNLVTRTDTAHDPTFAELLQRTRAANLAAYDHQELPFDLLVEVLNPQRMAARPPLAQVMLAPRSLPPADSYMPGVTISAREINTGKVKFDLAYVFDEMLGPDGTPQGISGVLEYSTDLFDRKTAEQIAGRFIRLLGTAAQDPNARLSQLAVLSSAERHQLLAEWAAGAELAFPSDQTVTTLVERQASRTPDAVSLIQGECRWTYAELDQRANQIAHVLAGLGMEPRGRVGLCLTRGPRFVAAALGVWKSGAAYVPLEAADPAERRSFLLRDSGASILLTEGNLDADMVLPPTVGVIRVDSDDRVRAAEITRLPPVATGSDLAYVVCTSGSTGKPKGVLTEHRGVLSRIRDAMDWFGLGPGDVNLQMISLGFEAPAREIFAPLAAGATVAILPPEGARDPESLLTTIRCSRPSVIMCVVPSVIEGLIAYGADAADFRTVRAIGTGGEFLRSGVARLMMESWGCTVINQYGPTETTMMACMHRVQTDDLAGAIPVGRPLSNTSIYVLDSARQPVPPGVTGEVYITGVGLARGYQGRPDLTRTQFVRNPFGNGHGRMYRSGDLGRWLPDGRLELVGRADDQLKVRGFRIEPGEIETVLSGHPEVSRSAVILREDRPGDPRLVAYIVPASPGSPPTPAGLRDHLAGQLPDYMIPTAFVVTDLLPLRMNGKLNRDLLPKPDVASMVGTRLPRSPREALLCELFADVLGVSEVGIDDDFFHLGGHSLLAARLIGRIRKALGVAPSMRTLFERPNVAGLAQDIGADCADGSLEVLLPLRTAGAGPALFCVHPGSGLSWSYVGLLKHVPAQLPVYGIQATGLLRFDQSPATIEEMAKGYIEQIRAVQPHGPYNLLGWSLGGMVAFEMAVQLQRAGAAVGLLALLDCYPGVPDHFRMNRQALLKSLLDPSRLHIIPEEGSAEFSAAVQLIRNDTGALASLSEAQIMAILRTMAHNSVIIRRYIPGHYSGTMMFFLASQDRVKGAPTETAWRDHIDGAVHCYRIEASHMTMISPEPLAQIGMILAEALDQSLDHS